MRTTNGLIDFLICVLLLAALGFGLHTALASPRIGEVFFDSFVWEADGALPKIADTGRLPPRATPAARTLQFLRVTTSGSDLRVRQSASTGSPVAGSLRDGQLLELCSDQHGWLEVSNGRLRGYVDARFVRRINLTPPGDYLSVCAS